jgi:dTDP-glucose pyrophosphorylase
MNMMNGGNSMINVVIPAAGEATRLRPLTSNCSKAMIRVHGKPTIEYIVDSLKKFDINQIVIVDGKFDDIREWTSKHENGNIKCVKQGSLNGPRDAIHVGINALTDQSLPLVVWLGDAIILEKDLPLGKDFLLTKSVNDHFSWCMWDGKNYYNKPNETIRDAVALVGLYSFECGASAAESFVTDKYDISSALVEYEKKRHGNDTFESIETNLWFDIGDIATYHRTSAELLSLKTRDFNSFEYDSDLNIITKLPKSKNVFAVKTLMNEMNWYKSLDAKQKMFTPKVMENDYGLSLSYESGTLLSDLFIHEDISNSTIDYLIEKVITSIRKYFHLQANMNFLSTFGDDAEHMWITKTRSRLSKNYNLTSQTKIFYERVADRCLRNANPVRTMHGDLHFGNVIYNPYNDKITFIDPRGEYGTSVTCGGDHLYDLCKLSHDIYHGYNGFVTNKKYPDYVRESFVKLIKKYYPNERDLIIDGGALLIATCIPLHYDSKERQEKMEAYVNEYANYSYRH